MGGESGGKWNFLKTMVVVVVWLGSLASGQLTTWTSVPLAGSTDNWCNATRCPPGTEYFGDHICSDDTSLWNLGTLLMTDPINLPFSVVLVESVEVTLRGVFGCHLFENDLLVVVTLGNQKSTVCSHRFNADSYTCYCSSCGVRIQCAPQDFPQGLMGYNTNGQFNLVQVLVVGQDSICLHSVDFNMTYTILEPSLLSLQPDASLISSLKAAGENASVLIHGHAFRTGSLTCHVGDWVLPGEALSSTLARCPLVSPNGTLIVDLPSKFPSSSMVVKVPISVSLEGLLFSNELTYSVYQDPHLIGVEPSYGPVSGGTPIVVRVSGVVPGVVYCQFGPLGVMIGYANDSGAVHCTSLGSGNFSGVVNVSVGYDGVDFSPEAVPFLYEYPLFPLINTTTGGGTGDGDDSDSSTDLFSWSHVWQYLGWISAAAIVVLMLLCCAAIILLVFLMPRRPQSGLLGQSMLDSTAAGADDTYPELDNLPTIDPTELVMGPRIGKGSFAEVFRASWRGTDVAVKKLSIHNLTEEFFKDFEREAFLMETLRHPNVLLFIGACLVPPDICIITEFMSRGSLYKILHSSIEIPWARAKSFAIDAARGMNYLHACDPPVLHRDLKSHNLLVDEHWRVKVCDFGLSRMLEQTLNTMTACGTPSWTAPEILRNSRYTEKADVYSFGVVLWEIVARKDPYPGMPPFHVVFAVGTQGIRPVMPRHAPANWVRLITQCWSEAPDERPSFSALLEMMAELEEPPDKSIPKPSSARKASSRGSCAVPVSAPVDAGPSDAAYSTSVDISNSLNTDPPSSQVSSIVDDVVGLENF